ncbi:sialate O-acetylesterase [uncultured Fibrobacter sp.]|uniref:sialate O-acetylesterase n=1 Tax=uncultured Fibrobacter sp. TaxID=261512 RepID=UPI00263369E7|nr:sialate O-acetylesterase [uncultured Fibrobacter sp.]
MKKVNLLGPLFGFALMAAASVYADPDPNFHIYLAFGQSNMEGQGTIESQDKTVNPRFQMLSTIDNFNGRKLGTWNEAIPPLANKHGGLGPTDYFGRTLVEKLDPQIRVGVVVVAIAGCSIVAFDSPMDQGYLNDQAGWFKDIVKDYGGDPYKRLVDMAKKAKEDGVIKGIIFHQGETDEGDSDWPGKVKKVYDRLVKDIGLDENIPFFAGEVPYQGSSKGTNNNIRKLPSQSKNFYLVSAEGLNDLDMMRIHFSSQGYRDFGKRYAEKVMEVLGDKLNPVATSTPESSSAETPTSSSGDAPASSGAENSSSSAGPADGSSSSVKSPESSADATSSSEGSEAIRAVQAKGVTIGKMVVSQNEIVVPVNLDRASRVNVSVYSVLGKQVMSMDAMFSAGENTVNLDASKLPVGNYLVSVQAGSARSTARIDIAR